jgi:hypothetical protein
MGQVNDATRRSLRWCTRQTQDVYWFGPNIPMSSARVALHQSACSRGIQAGRERDGSQVSVSGCVHVFECVLSILPLLGVCFSIFHLFLSRVPPSPFIVCKGRGRVTVFGCTKIERKGLKVLSIASLPLCSCIYTVAVMVVVDIC